MKYFLFEIAIIFIISFVLFFLLKTFNIEISNMFVTGLIGLFPPIALFNIFVVGISSPMRGLLFLIFYLIPSAIFTTIISIPLKVNNLIMLNAIFVVVLMVMIPVLWVFGLFSSCFNIPLLSKLMSC